MNHDQFLARLRPLTKEDVRAALNRISEAGESSDLLIIDSLGGVPSKPKPSRLPTNRYEREDVI